MYILGFSHEIRENKMTTEKKRAASGTVNLQQIINDTIKRIKDIDSNPEFDQSEKTRRHRALAASVKNQLHEDGRKRDDHRVGLSTYRRYMTNVRNAITAENWHHHSIKSKIEVLANRYPEFSKLIKSIKQKNISDTRKRYQEVLKEMRGHTEAYEDVKGLKLDHEIMRHLTLPSAKKAQLAEDQQNALDQKKHSTISIELPWLMATIKSLLTPDTTKKNISYSRLALGIAFATGRRAIEVVYQGKFKKAGEYQLDFSGAAKKRGGADYSANYRIYTLMPADDVLNAIKILKQQPEVQALADLDDMPETARNTAVNQRMGKTMNETAKRVWMDKDRVFKDSRAIWARLVFEQHFKTDKRWAKVDEDVFWHEMLCHEDIETQKAYKQFKIIEPEKTQNEGPISRLQAVTNLLDTPEIMQRKALVKITNWAVDTIKQDPLAVINQNRIIQEVGSGRKVIGDWLKLADDALNVSTIAETKVKPEPVTTVKKLSKPRLRAQKIQEGLFEVSISVENVDYDYLIEADDRMNALSMAWDEYQAETTP